MPIEAVKVTRVVVATPTVEIVKVAEVAPDGTATVDGTVVLGSLDVRFTTVPLAPAGPDNVTVPVAEAPPLTPFGATDIPVRDAAVMVTVEDWELPFALAVIAADVVEETPDVEMVNVALVPPLAICTVDGTVTAGLLLLRLMVVPL